MKRLFELLFMLTLITACAHCGIETDFQPRVIDPHLLKILKEFEQDRKDHGAPRLETYMWQLRYVDRDEKLLDLQSLNDKGDTIGICYLINEELAFVYIDKYFKTADPYSRKLIVYHEFGHCVLGLGHNENKVEGPEIGIMNPSLPADPFHSAIVKYWWPVLVEDLFDQANGSIQIIMDEEESHGHSDFRLKKGEL